MCLLPHGTKLIKLIPATPSSIFWARCSRIGARRNGLGKKQINKQSILHFELLAGSPKILRVLMHSVTGRLPNSSYPTRKNSCQDTWMVKRVY
jgi:hypothetical protein